MKKIIILASGSGSNAENIVQYFNRDARVEVALILTNNPQAGVIARANSLGVACMSFNQVLYQKTEYLQKIIQNINPDLIVLAGFLKKIPNSWVQSFPNKIVNIHPALLPKYGGKGMYGMHVHQAVIDAAEKESGITIHYVNEQYDAGQIIFQAKTGLSENDTPDSLAEKIQLLEHKHFPEIIEQLVFK
ncbi:MAG: phosphoribosylglycinamide formyltransferase [Bacteroidetes bacterium HGW-Bacteroidetes-13]|jgi:phosphoribosylglycinamide formyltransferase-1|nr:MAG: phosphoribosylglycinamide formyltransferase [Bacteroidetes bacterium HGW-Bacteroidetes-13]